MRIAALVFISVLDQFIAICSTTWVIWSQSFSGLTNMRVCSSWCSTEWLEKYFEIILQHGDIEVECLKKMRVWFHTPGQWHSRNFGGRAVLEWGCHDCCHFGNWHKCCICGACSGDLQVWQHASQIWPDGYILLTIPWHLLSYLVLQILGVPHFSAVGHSWRLSLECLCVQTSSFQLQHDCFWETQVWYVQWHSILQWKFEQQGLQHYTEGVQGFVYILSKGIFFLL